ncbi:hypothetical protein E2542_SST07410 [Spatholobus suberectus]|nr:hypothetical protein E2542_SST07410 [Spatholobus suberectus]
MRLFSSRSKVVRVKRTLLTMAGISHPVQFQVITGKCLRVFEGKTEKRRVGVTECKFDGSNPFQLFAFHFHYQKAFCFLAAEIVQLR